MRFAECESICAKRIYGVCIGGDGGGVWLQLVIVGHSERRHYTAENSAKAVMRIKRAVDAGITPIYCIGETQSEHAAGDAKQVIEAQLLALLDLDKASLEKVKSFGLVIAYEPVWAIGTGQAATPALA